MKCFFLRAIIIGSTGKMPISFCSRIYSSVHTSPHPFQSCALQLLKCIGSDISLRIYSPITRDPFIASSAYHASMLIKTFSQDLECTLFSITAFPCISSFESCRSSFLSSILVFNSPACHTVAVSQCLRSPLLATFPQDSNSQFCSRLT